MNQVITTNMSITTINAPNCGSSSQYSHVGRLDDCMYPADLANITATKIIASNENIPCVNSPNFTSSPPLKSPNKISTVRNTNIITTTAGSEFVIIFTTSYSGIIVPVMCGISTRNVIASEIAI